MSAYRRKSIGRPYGAGSQPRLLTSVLLLIIISMIYTQARNASNWKWLEAQEIDSEKPVKTLPPREWKEVVIDAPHDGNPEELAASRMQFEVITDRQPLNADDTPSYHRLMKWARAQPFDDLEVRADRKVFYRHFFESPKENRGKLFRLRLHVQQIDVHDNLSQNSAQARKLYELWGFTDESRSHPYVVVVPEIPSWFKTGPKVEEECVFVGYFLKVMAYEAYQTHRGAPLLLGRLRPISGPAKKANAGPSAIEYALGGGVVVIVLVMIGLAVKSRRKGLALRAQKKGSVDGVSDWLAQESAAEPQAPALVGAVASVASQASPELGVATSTEPPKPPAQ